jgi:hypothetical protein
MPSNPNPSRISTALWRFWTEFKAFEKGAQYGGTFAPKPGYHSYRSRLGSGDYSVGQVSNDRQGSTEKSSAIDITLSTANMIKYSKRLDAAMRAKDKRLFIGGAAILREYIGTKNGTTVSCYVLTGGRALGVGADSGSDSGRDKSHLWHIHLSFIRKFCESWDAMERVLSILKGETYSAWAKRHQVPATPRPKPKPTAPAKPAAPKPAGLPSYKNGSRELKAGMQGTDVKYVQTWIGAKRMGAADGKAGPKFSAGVKWYQQMRGLPADGIVGKRTWAAMGVR